MTEEELLKQYRSLAKRADQRLVRLEALAHEKNYKNVKAYSYANAMQDIKVWGGKNRFNTTPPTLKDGSVDVRRLQRKINDIQSFLNSPTSTKLGIKKEYQKRAKTVNEKYIGDLKGGAKLTWEDLANYYESGNSELSKLNIDSGTVIRVLSIAKKQLKTDDQVKKIQDYTSSNKKITGVSNVENEIISKLAQNGLTFNDLIK